MNKLGKMSFGGFVFPVTQEGIRIRQGNRVSGSSMQDGSGIISLTGKKPVVISGRGQFIGDGCTEYFEQLRGLMNSGGILYIPSQSPVYAYLVKLELVCEDMEGAVSYSFEFKCSKENDVRENRNFIYGNGESCLWDYAYNYVIEIDWLVRLNPHIRRPDIGVGGNERIFLC